MKKRILFLIPTLMHGGAEKVLVNLVNNLDKEKYDITLQSLFDCGVNKKFLKDTVSYKSNFKKIYRGSTWIMKAFSPGMLYKNLIKEKYDIIVSFLEGPTARILAGCPFEETKKIAWIHIEQKDKKTFSRSFRSYSEAVKLYYKFDKIICVSNTVKEDFISLSNQEKDVEVLYNVNDTKNIVLKSEEEVTDCMFKSDVPVFCSVAKVTKTKGYERLVNVHKRLIDEGYFHKIIIIGTGEEEEKINKRIREENIQDSFVLLGFKENPYKYMKKCDGYICSSFREGFSTAVTEALVLGLATVSTECSGAKELLGESDEFGIVVENSENGIYYGIKKMLENENIKIFKEKAVARGKMFSTEKTVKKVEELLDCLGKESIY